MVIGLVGGSIFKTAFKNASLWSKRYIGRRRLTSSLLVYSTSLSSFLLIIWLILYKLVIKTLLSF